MTTNFPTSLDTFSNPASGTAMNASTPLTHSVQHSNINDAMAAVQTKIGTDSSTSTSTLEMRAPKYCTSSTRPTGVAGRVIYETDTNRVLAYNGSAWIDVNLLTRTHGCALRNSVTQAIADVTTTNIVFDTEISDTDNYHTALSPTRITIPANLGGVYAVTAYARYDATSVTLPIIGIQKNGTAIVRSIGPTGVYGTAACAAHVLCVAGDYLQMFTFHTTGATRTLDTATGTSLDPPAPFFSAWLISGPSA